MRILIIDRQTWRYGGVCNFPIKGTTKLLNEEGLMCCLGFYLLSLGFHKLDIFDVGNPSNMNGFTTRKIKEWVNKAIEINDDSRMKDDVREKELIKHFLKHPEEPVELSFIN